MKKYTVFCLLLLVILSGCEEVERGAPFKEGVKPSPVTDVIVKNTAGGADISYLLPKNEDVLYVEAEYFLRDVVQHKKTSYMGNSISLEGFPDMNPYTINLYAVSRSGLRSDPVEVVINPLMPPHEVAFRSLSLDATFGGVKVGFENESEANLKLIVLTPDSLGYLYTPYIYYTQRKEGDFSVRGFDAVERSFGVYVLDRWGNVSDTIFTSLIPWFEIKLDNSKFSSPQLAGDVWEQHNVSGSIASLWDNVWNVSTPVFHTRPSSGIPQSFTINLGTMAYLSRLKIYHRSTGSNDGQYSAGAPKKIDIYGSNNPTSDWSGWTYLGRFESIKPSGGASWTAEDRYYACEEGEDFELDTQEAFRYVRFNVIENWGGVTYIYLAEIVIWGAPEE